MEIFDELIKSSHSPMGVFSWIQILWSLALSLILSSVVSKFYEKYGKTASTPANLGPTLIILCLTIAFIMQVVGNSVARAFSLAGALSIVRFRNAIKETEDIAVIFLVMAIGLACGSGFYMLPSIATIFIIGVWLWLKHTQLEQYGKGFTLLTLEAESGTSIDNAFKNVQISKLCDEVALMQTRVNPQTNQTSYVYQLKVKNKIEAEEQILLPISKQPGIQDVGITYQTF